MGVLANLVIQAQPALIGGGCNGRGTAGASWRWTFLVKNPDGTVVNLSGVTCVCKIVAAAGGAVIATLTASGDASGVLTVEMDESVTVALTPFFASWYCTLSDGTDLVWVWTPTTSRFTIETGV